MDQLVIRNQKGDDVTTSLIVADVFGKRHDQVLRDIDNLNCSQEFNHHNFVEIEYTDGRGRKQRAVEMTKNGFTFLVVGWTGQKAGEFKEKFIHEFDKRDALLKNDDYILMRSQQILSTRLSLVEKQLEEANTVIEELQPKRIFAEAVSASKTSILIGELAKLLKQNGIDIGQNRLFDWLRENSYLISRKGTDFNMPTQKSMDLDLFEIKETTINHSDGHISISKTPKVTGKGQVYFINKFLNHKEKATG